MEKMNGNDNKRKFEEAPASLKSAVWDHFGFSVECDDQGKKTVDKQRTVCKHCFSSFVYSSGSRAARVLSLVGRYPLHVTLSAPCFQMQLGEHLLHKKIRQLASCLIAVNEHIANSLWVSFIFVFLPKTLRQKKVRLFTITDMILIRTVSETEDQNGYLNRTVDTLIRFTTSRHTVFSEVCVHF